MPSNSGLLRNIRATLRDLPWIRKVTTSAAKAEGARTVDITLNRAINRVDEVGTAARMKRVAYVFLVTRGSPVHGR